MIWSPRGSVHFSGFENGSRNGSRGAILIEEMAKSAVWNQNADFEPPDRNSLGIVLIRLQVLIQLPFQHIQLLAKCYLGWSVFTMHARKENNEKRLKALAFLSSKSELLLKAALLTQCALETGLIVLEDIAHVVLVVARRWASAAPRDTRRATPRRPRGAPCCMVSTTRSSCSR